MERTQVNLDLLVELGQEYPAEFTAFCEVHHLIPPKISTKNGKALYAMLFFAQGYWTRDSCDQFVKKFGIETKDSIQLFNKHEQWGMKTSSERGKNYIVYPYQLSNKHKMRKDFKFDGTEQQKGIEIDKIKSTIQHDYVDVPNEQWQLGHKNPESEDNSTDNLVLQPPIQAKYRDHYIFIDTLTKIPTPSTLKKMYMNGQSPYTPSQLKEFKEFLNSLENI